ncbi:MAG TPA: hypothetical protein VGN46_16380 [Luteibacter sp.]|jgi:hypothetical protein|uniref:hypothetical protein n=1 Tax=Luteibacter sp. TaxID=1886636 RepID=UPI002F40513E
MPESNDLDGERDLFHAAVVCSFTAPVMALAYFTALFPGTPNGGVYLFVLLFALVWVISAILTMVLGLPFALWLHRRHALRWTTVCSYGAVAGMAALAWTDTAYGAIFGFGNAVIFQAICTGRETRSSAIARKRAPTRAFTDLL